MMHVSKSNSRFSYSPVRENGRHVQILAVIAVFILMLVSLFFSFPFNDHSSVLAPGIVLCVYNVYAFLVCGHRTVNAASVASYGTFMFIGFPAVHEGLGLYSSAKAYTSQSLSAVVFLAFLFQTVILLTSNKVVVDRRVNKYRVDTHINSVVLKSIYWLSVFMMISSASAHFLGVSFAASGFSWVAILASAILVFCTRQNSWRFRGLLVMLGSFVIENDSLIGGFGRLNLAVLALSVVVIASFGLRSWLVKGITVLMSGPALLFLVNQRVEFLQRERGGFVTDSEGIGSVVGPFHSAGTIIEAMIQGSLGLAWGATLFAALVVWIPRDFWPEKPVGFGREIVEVTQPWLVSNGSHSDAATFIGEAVWNFGLWGSPLYLISFAFLVKYLDRALEDVTSREPEYRNLIFFVIVALVTGSLLNIIWGSFSTAAARTLFPLGILLLLWVVGPKLLTRKTKI